MKRIMSIVLMIGLLLSIQAIAEQSLFTSEQTEQKLEAMIPILDSLALCLKVTENGEEDLNPGDDQPAFNAEDDALVWSQLRILSENWLSKNPEYRSADDETISVPAEVLDGCAAASFQGLVMAPMLSGVVTDGEMIYDDAKDTYVMTMNATEPHETIIERNAQDGDDMVVNCGIYAPETNERLGGLTARLHPADEGAIYPYSVTDAHSEDPNDFNGLWTNYCEIRFADEAEVTANDFDTLPVPVVTPTPEPTVKPTPTPRRSSSSSSSSSSSAAAYKRLSKGSRGSEVRDLQKRLNELGYDCGIADGIYGAATESAVRLFQNALDVEENGVASASIQQKLFAHNAPEYEKYTTLRKGDRGIRVEKLQDRLRELGYTGHPADGIYDNRIVDAVGLFQETADLDVDGIADVETQKALFSSDALECIEYIALEKDDSGIRVEEMQKQLMRLGYLSKASQKYDSKTVKAVASYKKSHGYSGNGNTADADLIAAMFSSSKSSSRRDEDEEEEDTEEEVTPTKETEKKPEKETEKEAEMDDPVKQPVPSTETEPETPSAEPETPSEPETESKPESDPEPESESPGDPAPEAEQPSEEKTEDHDDTQESPKEESREKETSESKEESSDPSSSESRERESEPEKSSEKESEKESSESKSEESVSSPEAE